LKETLEGIAENLFVQDPYLQSGGDMVRMGGLDYTIDPAQSLGNRISNIVLLRGGFFLWFLSFSSIGQLNKLTEKIRVRS
jgi:hypothetical protein